MGIQFRTPVSATPRTTTADGPVAFSFEIWITDGNTDPITVEYTIVEPGSAVFFASGGKSTTLPQVVSAQLMSISHATSFLCGHGRQDFLGATILVTLIQSGVLAATPMVCSVGISGYTCAPSPDAPATAPQLTNALLANAFTAAVMPFAASPAKLVPAKKRVPEKPIARKQTAKKQTAKKQTAKKQTAKKATAKKVAPRLRRNS